MSRYLRALRDLGISDTNALESLTPLLEAYYTASSRLHRALAPHGGTTHSALSRAASPSHDPDAEEVMFVTVFDKLGVLSITDDYTARITDALFRYAWRHHQANCFVAHLAASQPPRASTVGGEQSSSDGCGNCALLSSPSPSHFTYGPQPPVVHPSDAAVSAVRLLIVAADKTANPTQTARKVASVALLALHRRVMSTVYTGGSANGAAADDDDRGCVIGEPPTPMARPAAGPRAGTSARPAAAVVSDGGVVGNVLCGQPTDKSRVVDDGMSSAAQAAATLFCSAQGKGSSNTTPPMSASASALVSSPTAAPSSTPAATPD